MRRRSIQRIGMALLAAAAVSLTLSTPTAAKPDAGTPMQWREVFSPDGTITKMYLPREQTATQLAPADVVAQADVVTIQYSGLSSERFDMVFIGDGYTAAEMDTLRKHAQAKWDEIAASAPWNKYKSFINVWLVNVISNESGVDNDPSPGVNRDTALDMYLWCNNIERLLCLNEAKARQYANQAPGVDAIVAVGNTAKYGGAGYRDLSTVSGANVLSGQIALHELGHSVGGLADEYYTPGTTYSGGELLAPNATTDSTGQKWASYLGRSTPDGGVIGAYQGGEQYEYGIYRPSQDSLMRSLNKPFNLVGLDVMDRAISAKISGGSTG